MKTFGVNKYWAICRTKCVTMKTHCAAVENVRKKGFRQDKVSRLTPGLDYPPGSYADTAELQAATGFKPATTVETGVRRFVDWYREYFK